MTQDHQQSVRDDIAYMRDLAHEGQKTPQLGGAVTMIAGAVFGAAALVHFLIDYGLIDLPAVSYMVLWGVAMAIVFAALFVECRRMVSKPGVHSPVNRAIGTTWTGMGMVSFVLALSMGLISWRMGSSVPFMLFPAMIVALYGAAWAVSAEMTGFKWQWKLAVGAWVAAPLLTLLTGTPFIWLGYAACLILFAFIPGLVLRRQEPAEII